MLRLTSNSNEVDRTPIELLRMEIKYVDACLDPLMYQRTVKARHYNSILPINRLPNELLIRIFPQCGYAEEKKYYGRLASLSEVCWSWAAVVQDTPSLWAYVYCCNPHQAVVKALEKSGSCALEVNYSEGTWLDEEGTDVWIEAVGDQLHRWQTANLRVWRHAVGGYLLDWVCQESAPLLERLEIRKDNDWGEEELLNVFEGGTERLRHLSLSGMSIPWTSIFFSQLSGLKTLEVLRTSYPGPSMFQLGHILTACPDLVTVYL